jgi:hypothetical protein
MGCSHLAFNDRKDADIERASVRVGPWLKWNFNTELTDVRVKKIVNLINPCASSY